MSSTKEEQEIISKYFKNKQKIKNKLILNIYSIVNKIKFIKYIKETRHPQYNNMGLSEAYNFCNEISREIEEKGLYFREFDIDKDGGLYDYWRELYDYIVIEKKRNSIKEKDIMIDIEFIEHSCKQNLSNSDMQFVKDVIEARRWAESLNNHEKRMLDILIKENQVIPTAC
jgi:hypothetical protein